MKVIGINAFHGDSSACLMIDGVMISAVEEERFRRVKHWAGFPSESIRFCLDSADLTLEEIDVIAINSDSNAARLKKLKYVLSGAASLALIKEKLLTRKKRQSIHDYLMECFPEHRFEGQVQHVEHHLAHLASAYSVSPYDSASIISVDGFGDFASTSWGLGVNGEIDLERRVYFPHSLGVFYQAMTQFMGFPHYGDEYKIMGLAPYGQNSFEAEMSELVRLKDDGSFELNLKYFCHHRKAIGYEWDNGSPKVSDMFDSNMSELFGVMRKPGEPLEQVHKDIAHSVQRCYEKTFFHMLNTLHASHQSRLGTPLDKLTVAGGCGMNSVANGKIHLHTPYKDIYIQSAAGDAGGAIGAAIIASKSAGGLKKNFAMQHSYWGPSYQDQEIQEIVEENDSRLTKNRCSVAHDVDDAKLFDLVSDALIEGKVIGWFQGAMEWGPRALGNRSILGDPRRKDMKDILNLKIKRRESFRPFAPSVLRDQVSNWFESDADVPFMMKVFQIKASMRDQIPAVTHVDGSGRLQTVTQESNHRYYHLIKSFFDKTGVPMLLNTSFNENEPVVCKPEEALDCFLRTEMDVLVLGSTLITRDSND